LSLRHMAICKLNKKKIQLCVEHERYIENHNIRSGDVGPRKY
jgi:hypothetical protein